MNKSTIKFLLCIITIAFVTPLFATPVSSKTGELQKLKQLIRELKNTLSSAHHKQSTLQQKLKHNETAAGNLAIKIKRTKHKLTRQQKTIRHLQHEKIQYRHLLVGQQQDFEKQMRATYMLGNQTYLRMLLNHQDPNQLNRTFMYYSYLQKSRIKTIDALKYTLKRLRINRLDILHQTQKLLVLKGDQQHEYTKLNIIKHKRKQLLTTINHDIKTKQQKLNKLIANQKALEKVIARLKAEEISPTFATPLSRLRRKLHWPTKGRIDYIYGESQNIAQVCYSRHYYPLSQLDRLCVPHHQLFCTGYYCGHIGSCSHGHGQ